MNYLQIYEDLILKAKSENRKKLKRNHKDYIYYENHHIIPKCCGGRNSKENLTLLTAKEHFIAHKLLVEIYDNKPSLVYALHRMIYSNSSNYNVRNYKIVAREFERIRILCSKIMSGESHPLYGIRGENHPAFKKAPWNKGLPKEQQPMFGKESAMKGVKRPEESNLKVGNALRGRVKSKEHCDNISKSLQDLPKIECEYCGKFITNGNYVRWHGDNCPENPSNNKEEILRKRSNINKREYISCIYCGIKSTPSVITRYHNENCLNNPNNNKEDIMKKRKYKIVICPHCGKEGGELMMKRWHFGNCKLNLNNLGKIFIINGVGGSGKDTFVDFIINNCKKYIINVTSSDEIKRVAKILGWNCKKDEKGRKFLSELMQLVRDYNDGIFNYWCEFIGNNSNKNNILFLHVREPNEIIKYVKKFNCKTILVERQNIKVPDNISDKGVMDYNYDIIIENSLGLKNLEELAIKFIKTQL